MKSIIPFKTILTTLFCGLISTAAFSQNWQQLADCVGGTSGNSYDGQLEFIGNSTFIAFADGAHNYKVSVLQDAGGGMNYTYLGNPGFSAGKATYLSTAVNNNQIYAAYRDEGNGNRLSVMRYNGSAWVYLGAPGFTPGAVEYTTIVFVGNTPYVAYKDASNGNKATVVGFDGTNWGYVGTSGFSPTAVDPIELGTDGTSLYVVYGDFANTNKATVKKFNGSNWVTVGSEGFSAAAVYTPRIAFDGTIPYVAFTDVSQGSKATVMTFNGSTWVNVGNPGFSDGGTSQINLALYEHEPYVGYGDVANCGFQGQGRRATVKRFNGTQWVNFGNSCLNNTAINTYANFYELVFRNGLAYAVTSGLCTGFATKINIHVYEEALSVTENWLSEIVVSPNPFSDRILLENLPHGTYNYNINDIMGKAIGYGVLNGQNEIRMPQLSAGMYVLQLSDSNGNLYPIKIVKQ